MGERADTRRVDPELLAAIDVWPANSINDGFIAGYRAAPPAPTPPSLPPAPQPVEHWIARAKGAPDLRLIVIDPLPQNGAKPALLHMFGGGYVLGQVDGRLPLLQSVALACECVIVTVDYRLAPESRFPHALEDNYAALAWLNANAQTLGIDCARIAVGGESAGGGHAAALALAVRDRGEFALVFQLLIYPMLDDRTGAVGACRAALAISSGPKAITATAGARCWASTRARTQYPPPPCLRVFRT